MDKRIFSMSAYATQRAAFRKTNLVLTLGYAVISSGRARRHGNGHCLCRARVKPFAETGLGKKTAAPPTAFARAGAAFGAPPLSASPAPAEAREPMSAAVIDVQSAQSLPSLPGNEGSPRCLKCAADDRSPAASDGTMMEAAPPLRLSREGRAGSPQRRAQGGCWEFSWTTAAKIAGSGNNIP